MTTLILNRALLNLQRVETMNAVYADENTIDRDRTRAASPFGIRPNTHLDYEDDEEAYDLERFPSKSTALESPRKLDVIDINSRTCRIFQV